MESCGTLSTSTSGFNRTIERQLHRLDGKNYALRVSILKAGMRWFYTKIVCFMVEATLRCTTPMVVGNNNVWEHSMGMMNKILKRLPKIKFTEFLFTHMTEGSTLNLYLHWIFNNSTKNLHFFDTNSRV
jgi:hypothetical protein